MNRKHSISICRCISAFACGVFLVLLLSADFSRESISASENEMNLLGQLTIRFGKFGIVHAFLAVLLPLVIYDTDVLHKGNTNKRNIWICVAGIVFGILNASGQQMYYTDGLPRTFVSHMVLWVYAIAGAVSFCYIAFFLCNHFYGFFYHKGVGTWERSTRKLFWVAFAVILAGWLPWMITYYPASADWDVYYPIRQYLNLTDRTNQQPWFYSCTVGFFYSLGVNYANKNAGMFLYIAIRALMMSAIYAWTVSKLAKQRIKKWVIWFVICFYAFVPVWGAYAKHAFKDTQGAALFCLYIILSVECINEIKNKHLCAKTAAFYSAATLFMSLYRNNCIYVAIPPTLLLVISAALNKEAKRKIKAVNCILLSLGILLFGCYKVYITKIEHITRGPYSEALSIPLQQTARTVRDHGPEITEDESEGLASVLDYDHLAEVYDPLLSDPVKRTFVNNSESVIKYFKIWTRMMLKYPVSYAEAALAQSYGYYAFTPDQAEHAGNWNCGMTIFDWTKDQRFSEELTCDYVESMEGARKLLDDWAKIWHNIPLLRLTDIKAIYTWLVILLGAVLLRKKEWLKIIPVLAFVLMILSCCASPVNDCFRYFAPVAAASPVLLLLAPGEKKNNRCNVGYHRTVRERVIHVRLPDRRRRAVRRGVRPGTDGYREKGADC